VSHKQYYCSGGLLVRLFFLTFLALVHLAASNEEAGHYLSTFKQFEHKPPDLIKERVDKDYDSILRSTLTSISKVNKTDVETLRTSFGVREGPPLYRPAV
jgi:hypothetical protein